MTADLATRIEREPPSRELDALIHRVTHPALADMLIDVDALGPPSTGWLVGGDHPSPVCAPHYTTSRDAAAELMPAGWVVAITQRIDGTWRCSAYRPYCDAIRGTAPTEPQARAAAALRAMEMERGT